MSPPRWTFSLPLTFILTLGLGFLMIAGTPFDTPVRAVDKVSDLAGTWTWSWKDPAGVTHRHILEVEGIDTRLAAREQFDGLEPVPAREIRRDGKSFRFTVVRGDRRADYQGVMADRNTINGTVKVTANGETIEDPWEATRKKVP
jgi:hypothetical protein